MRMITKSVLHRTWATLALAVSWVSFAHTLLAAEDPLGTAEPAEKAAVSYFRDVRPILQAHCQGCHQPAKLGGSIDLTAAQGALATGDSGTPAVVPGKPDESYLLDQITPVDGEAAMPQGKPPLSEAQVALVRRWIEEGARDDTPSGAAQSIDAEHPPLYSGPPVITSLDWSPDGTLLAIAGFHEVLLHKADGSGLAARLVGLSPRIESVRFSPDGTKLAVTGGRPAQLGEVQIWDVRERELLHSIPVSHDSLYGASWSPDGKRVAFGAADSAVRAIDIETGEQVLYQSAHDDWVLDTVFSVDGSHLVSVGRDMAAKLIEVASQRFIDNITSITPGALKGGIQTVERHPLRDEILFGGADGTPRIYRMHRTVARRIGDDSNLLWELPPLPGRIFSVDISADGRTMVAASSLDGHGHVHVYRMEPAPAIPDAIRAILEKPVPQRSAAETSQLQKHFAEGVQTLARIEVAEGGVYAVALSPGGERVAAAGADGTVRIIDAQSGSIVASFVPVELHARDEVDQLGEPGRDLDSGPAETRLRQDEPPLPVGDAIVEIVVEPSVIRLDSPARYAQLIVTAKLQSGARIDITRHANLQFSAPVAVADAAGAVAPRENGHALLTVQVGDKSASLDVEVTGLDAPSKPDFVRDVAPILARAGCNQGTCHGAQDGKNGFKLSLRGYDPVFDVRALADDLASRRVNIASPGDSLMLLKPTAAVPHEGGQLLKAGSLYYETVRQWIADGAHLNLASPRVTKISVLPRNPIVESIGARQQVRVVAAYADGSERDVTREAFVESGNTDVVQTVPEQAGLLEALRRGEAAVLVRYEGNYAATTLTVMGDREGFAWEDMPANNRIDELVAAKLQRTKTLPSRLSDDYEFVRRVYLDLTGLPPTPEQIGEFMDDPSESRVKREALVDRLVGGDDYIEYWTNKWADLLLVNRKFLGAEGATALRAWIRGEIAANTPYDQFVSKVITATGSNKENPAAAYYKIHRTPDALVENTTHVFLATRFNCNKCHDHPFERWTQDQYYQLAAYFAQVTLSKDPASGDAAIGGTAVESARPLYEIVSDASEGEVKHERTGEITAPAFPFTCDYEVKQGASRREELAAWLTSPGNPYFARSYVNRLWGYLTGQGIIEPLDDIRAGNPPTNPELLDFLTSEFIESGFNTRHIVALICKSRTYQLAVETNRWNEDDQINFSHARARRLPAEVLFDAIYRTTGATPVFAGVAPGTRASALPDVGIELPDGFLGNLGRPAREAACECERSSNLQLGPIMSLVSGPTVGNAISDPANAIAKLVAGVPDDRELVRRLFLRFLNRPARPEEVSAAAEMFEQPEADHAQLVAEFEAYAKKIAPQVAERELERQGRVAGLQARIEAERELAKLRRPRLDAERQQRIDQARAALAAYEQQLAAKLPEWEAAQASQTVWRTLEPVELTAAYGASFARENDGSILVGGDNGKGAYRIVAPLPLDRITGVRLEALADERLPGRGPGRSTGGNFVVTELTARLVTAPASMKLVSSWDFSSPAEDWQAEEGVKLVAEAGLWHLFGNAERRGITTAVAAPPGTYFVELVTGVRPAVTCSVQWSTAGQPAFQDARSARRTFAAGEGGRLLLPIPITADTDLTGLRIVVEGAGSVLPIDAVRLFAAEGTPYMDLALKDAKATFSQSAYPVASAIDGNAAAEANNGWAVAPRLGRNHTASFELASPVETAAHQLLELTIHQNYQDGQHSLGRFRVSVTDSATPVNFGLPPAVVTALIKPASDRSDADREILMNQFRAGDKDNKKLQEKLAAAERPVPEDPRLKELEAELAQAQQPLSIDAKLQQLRRAIALSEEQLKNKRLTVAQDLAWALINSPAFLYNH